MGAATQGFWIRNLLWPWDHHFTLNPEAVVGWIRLRSFPDPLRSSGASALEGRHGCSHLLRGLFSSASAGAVRALFLGIAAGRSQLEPGWVPSPNRPQMTFQGRGEPLYAAIGEQAGVSIVAGYRCSIISRSILWGRFRVRGQHVLQRPGGLPPRDKSSCRHHGTAFARRCPARY